MTVDELFNILIENQFFTEKELKLVTNINGYSIETLNDCIYDRYGYRSCDQLLNEYR